MSLNNRAWAILQAENVEKHGHFVLSGERHSDTYFSCKPKNMRSQSISDLCAMMAAQHLIDNIEVVVGPAEGGVILAEHTARHLSVMLSRPVPHVVALKDGSGGFRFNPEDEQLIRGRRVLIVEDVLTSGASVKKVVFLVYASDGEVVAVSALVNRGRVQVEDVGVRVLNVLVERPANNWTEAECQASHLCHAGVLINTDFGHGAAYLAKKYPT